MNNTIGLTDFLLCTLDTFLINSLDLIFIKDTDLNYVTASKAFLNMAGLSSPEEVRGKTDYDFFDEDLARRYTEDDQQVLKTGTSIIGIIEPLPDHNGKKSYSSTSKHAIRDREGKIIGLYGVGRDVTAKIQLQEEIRKREILKQKAETDALTGLLNRENTLKRMEDCLTGYGSQQMHALLFIDLDYFKQINDQFGHLVGDQVLQTAATQLQKQMRKSDILGRIGGDEFLALIKNVSSEADARRKAQLLTQQIAHCEFENNCELSITCSVGVAIYQGDGKSLPELYEAADQAMYRAKEGGRNRITF